MNAMARRDIVCWVSLLLCGTALYGQETTGEKPKPKDPQNLSDESQEHVRKLTLELKARAVDFEKLQAQLRQTEADKEAMSAELQKLRRALEDTAAERKTAEERARQQLQEIEAKMRHWMARQPGHEVQDGLHANPLLEEKGAPRAENELLDNLKAHSARLEEAARATAANAMQRAAGALGAASRQAEETASRLAEARLSQQSGGANNLDEGWQQLLLRADVMLQETRRNEEAAANYRPKLESALTQLRKAGRNAEADQLQAEANMLLGQDHPSPNMPRDDSRPANARRDFRPPRAGGDVEHAVNELRREVEQLRGEVRELRHLLQRGAKGDESDHQERNGDRERSDLRSSARDRVSVRSRHAAQVLRVGAASRSLRAGDRVKKGETLAVLFSQELADKMGQLVDAQKKLDLDSAIYDKLKAIGPEAAPAQEIVARSAVDADQSAVETLKREVLAWPWSEEAISRRLTSLEKNEAEADSTRLGEFALGAPADGRIIERNVSVGEIVDPGALLFQIEVDDPHGKRAAQLH